MKNICASPRLVVHRRSITNIGRCLRTIWLQFMNVHIIYYVIHNMEKLFLGNVNCRCTKSCINPESHKMIWKFRFRYIITFPHYIEVWAANCQTQRITNTFCSHFSNTPLKRWLHYRRCRCRCRECFSVSLKESNDGHCHSLLKRNGAASIALKRETEKNYFQL